MKTHDIHFCTLCDRNFLPIAVTLSLSMKNSWMANPLTIFCMDDYTYACLNKIKSAINVKPVNVQEYLSDDIKTLKNKRKIQEYCWTIKPFLIDYMFAIDPEIQIAAFVDSDLYFFMNPELLLLEDFSNNPQLNVLLTYHQFAPRYKRGERFGKTCTQFYAFKKTEKALDILRWWQKKCIECCDNRVTATTFSDQKHLDFVPDKYKHAIGYLSNKQAILGPWNVEHYMKDKSEDWFPICYHAHGLRVYSNWTVRLLTGYKLPSAYRFYHEYMEHLKIAVKLIQQHCGADVIQVQSKTTPRQILMKMLGIHWELTFKQYMGGFNSEGNAG